MNGKKYIVSTYIFNLLRQSVEKIAETNFDNEVDAVFGIVGQRMFAVDLGYESTLEIKDSITGYRENHFKKGEIELVFIMEVQDENQ